MSQPGPRRVFRSLIYESSASSSPLAGNIQEGSRAAIPCQRCADCQQVDVKHERGHTLQDHPLTRDWWPTRLCLDALYECSAGHLHALCPRCEEESVTGVDPTRAILRITVWDPLTEREAGVGRAMAEMMTEGSITPVFGVEGASTRRREFTAATMRDPAGLSDAGVRRADDPQGIRCSSPPTSAVPGSFQSSPAAVVALAGLGSSTSTCLPGRKPDP